jgi:Fe-S cluster biogenesis protein NfuA
MTLKEEVEKVLDEDIRPALIADGGNVTVVDVEEEKGEVYLKLEGACAGCPMSQVTLKNFVEQVLKEKIPEVKKVLAV